MLKEELIDILKCKEHLILAIDGMCGAGKSTLAKELVAMLGGNLFCLDDFFLPEDKRTMERLSEPGGNVDYERFLVEVLLPLSKQQTVHYRAFDCHTMSFQPTQDIPFHPFNIIEGSYALHPALRDYYSDCVVLQISSQEQRNRLQKRNPQQLEKFIKCWIPLENKYFDYYHLYQNYPIIKMD